MVCHYTLEAQTIKFRDLSNLGTKSTLQFSSPGSFSHLHHHYFYSPDLPLKFNFSPSLFHPVSQNFSIQQPSGSVNSGFITVSNGLHHRRPIYYPHRFQLLVCKGAQLTSLAILSCFSTRRFMILLSL